VAVKAAHKEGYAKLEEVSENIKNQLYREQYAAKRCQDVAGEIAGLTSLEAIAEKLGTTVSTLSDVTFSTNSAPSTEPAFVGAVAAAKEEAKKVEKKAEKKVEKPAVTEAICTVWNIRTTPRKVRLVCDVVRGKSVAEALGILSRLNKAASLTVAKAIKSAAANAVNNFGMQENLLYVAEIQASDGLRIKRFIPRAKGSASGLVKRNANLRVIVKEAK
jgi:large subunit ribosomal protein L22